MHGDRQLHWEDLQLATSMLPPKHVAASLGLAHILRFHSCAQVYIGNLVGGLVTEEALRQLFNNTMAAAFPDQVRRFPHFVFCSPYVLCLVFPVALFPVVVPYRILQIILASCTQPSQADRRCDF